MREKENTPENSSLLDIPMKPTKEMIEALQADTGIPHPPTDLTYECRLGVNGEGPRAATWDDKPHRLVFELCLEVERTAAAIAAMPGPAVRVKPDEFNEDGSPTYATVSDRIRSTHKTAVMPAPDLQAENERLMVGQQIDWILRPAEPEEIAAAWEAWRFRHGGKLGPGPAFVEAINAAFAARKKGMEK